jgi:hypothetical protein
MGEFIQAVAGKEADRVGETGAGLRLKNHSITERGFKKRFPALNARECVFVDILHSCITMT